MKTYSDIQGSYDLRKEKIDKVGVKNLSYPIVVQDRAKEFQSTVADIDFYVELPHFHRGTHMSRFIEILNTYHRESIVENLQQLLKDIKDSLSADRSYIKLKFPYFIKKKAPISGIESMMNYNCYFEGEHTDKFELTIGVEVPITTVCPCSKELSNHGAHNQRSIIGMFVKYKNFVWLEELIDYAESVASSPVYALLKRTDEKYVTEKGYENAKFVEDIVRDLSIILKKDTRITYFHIYSENYESIHNHNAYASIEWSRNSTIKRS